MLYLQKSRIFLHLLRQLRSQFMEGLEWPLILQGSNVTLTILSWLFQQSFLDRQEVFHT